MRHALVFEQSPPPGVPLPFFLVAPLFAIAAFLLFALAGPELSLVRWDGRIIAALHLFTLGYLLPNMMAAVLQMAPVLTGRAPLANPWGARVLRFALFTGALLFTIGLYAREQHAIHLAVLSLAMAVALFLLRAIRSTGFPGIIRKRGPGRGIVLAVAGFAIAAGIGLRLLAGHGWDAVSLPRQWTDVHAGWAMLGWIAPLIMVAGGVVIPMFQHTRPLPGFASLLPAGCALGMLLATFKFTRVPGLLLALGACVAFAVIVLWLQSGRRNVTTDATTRLFRGAMVSLLVAAAIFAWLLIAGRTPLRESLVATLFLAGFAMSCVMGMSFKIVPFLLRFHLQRDLWQLDLPARTLPSFTALLPETWARASARTHFTGLALLAAAVFFTNDILHYLALALLITGQALSLAALWHAVLHARRLRRQFHAAARELQEENHVTCS